MSPRPVSAVSPRRDGSKPHREPPQTAAFRSGSTSVRVRVDARHGRLLDVLFPDYRASWTPSSAADAPDLELRELSDGRLMVEGARGARTYQDSSQAVTSFEWLLTHALAEGVAGPLLHAGGVETRRGGLLLPGDSGAGKSSLTTAFATRGFPLLGDDAVVLDPPVVAPFKRLIKVHESAGSDLGLPAGLGTLESLWSGVRFYRPDMLGSRWSEGTRVRWVVFPERVAGATITLSDVAPGIAVRRLMELVVDAGGAPARAFKRRHPGRGRCDLPPPTIREQSRGRPAVGEPVGASTPGHARARAGATDRTREHRPWRDRSRARRGERTRCSS